MVLLCASSNDCLVFYVRCDPGALTDALCKRVMVTPEEVIKRSLDPYSATISRDGLAKTIYSRLFDWYRIVSFCSLLHMLQVSKFHCNTGERLHSLFQPIIILQAC